jgi:large conductance mechanosensitive channel
VIVAAVLYFGIVRPYQLLKDKLAKNAPPAPPTTDDLLTEIRDLLAKKS